ncbi:MAG: hypothetical protein LBB44_01710 [Endomicrobium sp.]|jgi:hypothetical protein|nr:hypothetical protein [Endomicrobium sp.]
MKGIETVDRERIVINGKEIKFDYPVGRIEVSESKIFVCLDVYDFIKFGDVKIFLISRIEKFIVNDNRKAEYRDTSRDVEGDDLNRVYCYDYEGKLVWQMQSPVHLLPKRKDFSKFDREHIIGEIYFRQYPILSMEYDRKKKKLFAVDWAGRYFDINLETGEPMSFEIKKI